jgi:light-regulated signal transduction histidine kinase (bacteriophytochrome)
MDKYEQVKDAIKESNQCLCTIFNHTFELMGLMKLDDIIVEINPTVLYFSEAISTKVIGRFFGKIILWAIAQQSQQALQVLRESEAIFRHTLEQSLIGIAHLDRVSRRLLVKLSVQYQETYYKFSVIDDGYTILLEYHHKIFVIFKTSKAWIRKENTGIFWGSLNESWKRQEVRLLWILFQERAVISLLLGLNNQITNIAQAYGTQC